MQNAIAIMIVLAAAAYLARLAWLKFYSPQGGACGSCPSCSANDTIKQRPLVTISMDMSRAETPSHKHQ
jgi:hypothetical protein